MPLDDSMAGIVLPCSLNLMASESEKTDIALSVVVLPAPLAPRRVTIRLHSLQVDLDCFDVSVSYMHINKLKQAHT